MQKNAIFVFISYNQQAKKRGNVKTCCRVEERQALLHPQRPRSLLHRLKSAENKPLSLTEIVRQTMYLWENGQKGLQKTQKWQNRLEAHFLGRLETIIDKNKKIRQIEQ